MGGNHEHYIDRWPAWLIASYACITIGLHTGILNCGALFYPALMETFDRPISVVAWLVTGQYAMAFCLSPLYNRLIDFIPHRIAITLAVFLTTGALISSSLVSNFWLFFFLYTVTAAIGMGISVVRAISTAAEYFDRYRVLALAICSSGTGLGTFVYSKIGAYLIDTYTWRIALIGYGLLHLHIIAIGLVLKPLPPESVPEPTVLISAHPDLTSAELPASVFQRKPESGQNLFLSVLSVNSMTGMGSTARLPPNRSRTELSRRNTIASDLRVVIEFVKSTKHETGIITFDPIAFLPDPGARVIKQLEAATQQAFESGDITTGQVMIPILFIVSDFDVIQMETHDPIVGSQLKFFLDSRFDISSATGRQPEETAGLAAPQQPRPVAVGDSFTSSMVVLQDRRRIRRTIRAVIERGQQKVSTIAEELKRRGLTVYSSPVVALVDQSTAEPAPTKPLLKVSGEPNYLWSNLALDNYVIPEEAEPTDRHTDGTTATGSTLPEPQTEAITTGRIERDRSRFIRRMSQLHGSQGAGDTRPFVWTARVKRKGSVTRPLDSVLIQSSSELPQVLTAGAQSRDIFASVISISSPHEAAQVLETKYLDELKGPAEDLDVGDPGKQKFLLADMMFFTFLLTRLFVFIADSIVFAHLSNFAILSGFDPEVAAGLLSFIGIANMLGRIGTGVIGQFAPGMELRCLTAACLLALAIYTVVMPLFPTYAALAVFAVSYGLLVSPSFAFAPSIAYEVVGPSRYDQAIAFVFQFEAIGYLVGGPMGGAIKEMHNNYFECFAFAGSNELVASTILFVQAFIIHGVCGKILRSLRDATVKSLA